MPHLVVGGHILYSIIQTDNLSPYSTRKDIPVANINWPPNANEYKTNKMKSTCLLQTKHAAANANHIPSARNADFKGELIQDLRNGGFQVTVKY